MARIPYPDLASERLAPQVAFIRGERGGRLSNLFAMQLHSPELMRAWIDLGSAIRYRTGLDAAVRELAICAVTRLLDYDFQWLAHAPLAVGAGVDPELLERLPDWRSVPALGDRDALVLEYTEAVTWSADVPDELFSRVEATFTPADIVELTATIAFYGLGARFLKVLRVTVDDDPYAQPTNPGTRGRTEEE